MCEQTITELRRTFNRKFPEKVEALDAFLARLITHVEISPVPEELCAEERLIRDETDRPILRSALWGEVDFLITGDKDFLEASVTKLKVISASQFLEKL